MLELTGLYAGYGDLEVLRNVSLTIGRGEIVGLLGANNAGKTTLVNCISRLVPWERGICKFEGRNISGLAPHEVTECGISQVPEGRQLFPAMTSNNVAVGIDEDWDGKAEFRDARGNLRNLLRRMGACIAPVRF